MSSDGPNINSGDKLILSAGCERRIWTVSAVNNQVVKYFDETGRYGQMPLAHLVEMLKTHRFQIETSESGQEKADA